MTNSGARGARSQRNTRSDQDFRTASLVGGNGIFDIVEDGIGNFEILAGAVCAAPAMLNCGKSAGAERRGKNGVDLKPRPPRSAGETEIARVKQSVPNLVSNAIKVHPSDGRESRDGFGRVEARGLAATRERYRRRHSRGRSQAGSEHSVFPGRQTISAGTRVTRHWACPIREGAVACTRRNQRAEQGFAKEPAWTVGSARIATQAEPSPRECRNVKPRCDPDYKKQAIR